MSGTPGPLSAVVPDGLVVEQVLVDLVVTPAAVALVVALPAAVHVNVKRVALPVLPAVHPLPSTPPHTTACPPRSSRRGKASTVGAIVRQA